MSCENCEESAYVIDKLAKLLAEIAIIVNGPEPPLTRWSYHDLPEKVRALKQAQQPAALADAAALAARLDKTLGCHADSMPKEAYFEVDAVMRALQAQQPAALAGPADVARHAAAAVSYLDHAGGMPAGLSLALQRLRDALAQQPAAAAPEGMMMVQRADIEALEAADFGRCGWSARADLAARRLRAAMLAAERKGE